MLAHELETSARLDAPRRDAAGMVIADRMQCVDSVGRCERDFRESPEPIGTNGKRDCVAGDPAGACVAIGGEELSMAMNGLDACPLASGRDPRRRLRRGSGLARQSPRLTQDHSPAQNTGASSHALDSRGGFRGEDSLAQLGQVL
jgi:hypothetical protein